MILKSITKWSMRLPLMARSWEPPKQGDDTASHENEEHNNSVRSGVAQQTAPASPGSLDQGDVLGQSFRLDADTITTCNACNAASNTTPAFSCRAARSCFAEDSCQCNRLDKCATAGRARFDMLQARLLRFTTTDRQIDLRLELKNLRRTSKAVRSAPLEVHPQN